MIINKKTSEDVLLGGEVLIPAGTYVGYNCYATGRDRKIWGDTADKFRPERWGTTMHDVNNRFRKANSSAEFISFHGGKRACIGQKFGMLEASASLFELVKRLKWGVDPTWPEKMTSVGHLHSLIPTCPSPLPMEKRKQVDCKLTLVRFVGWSAVPAGAAAGIPSSRGYQTPRGNLSSALEQLPHCRSV